MSALDIVRLALKTICIFGYNLSKFQETYIWHQETPNNLIPIFPITFTPARPILRISSIWRTSWISRWPPFLKFSQISNKNGQITTEEILRMGLAGVNVMGKIGIKWFGVSWCHIYICFLEVTKIIPENAYEFEFGYTSAWTNNQI